MRLCALALIVVGCGSTHPSGPTRNGAVKPVSYDAAGTTGAIKTVFVITLENQDTSSIYGNKNAPYINGLMNAYAYAERYGDDYKNPDLPSEPHYVEMEAGTNAFSDHTFTTDDDVSATNSTASTAHFTSSLSGNASWMSYQENLPAACPIASSFPYAPKHDPFVFFRDVSFTNGKADKNNAYCAAHHKDYAASFAADLTNSAVATYNFITPNLCDDMHGDLRCSNGCSVAAVGYGPCVAAGDTWLSTNLPPLIDYINANDGVIFLVWDEAEDTDYEPFLVISPNLVATGANDVALSHASLVKSLDEIFGVTVPDTVANANDFASFFKSGTFP